MYAGLLFDAMMIALFACWRLDQNGNGGANADNNKSSPKSLIVSDYSRIRYYNRILLKFGCAPITNMISDTYRTISVIPYWELTHRANPNIHHTPRTVCTIVRTCGYYHTYLTCDHAQRVFCFLPLGGANNRLSEGFCPHLSACRPKNTYST